MSLDDASIEPKIAVAYHQLGNIAYERLQFEQAEDWYRKALEIRERLGLERDAASDYHQLGMVVQERLQFEQAETWYRKALAIFERLGHPPLRVNTLAQLGVLFRKQQRFEQAISWFGRALFIAVEFRMRVQTRILMDLARVMESMGERAFEVEWRRQFPNQEPPMGVLRDILRQLNDDKRTE